ncbi:glycosyl transferase [Candidatus Roizmanbacteria bacterium RIFCSPLOWO2_01_FULL_37_57]|nr:MAG: glycosyl transferase [Candidatus Roizmanbacteria bacterium RIFCSPLOWO2_01_FULL_37_57]
MNKKYLQKQISISAFFPCYNDAGSIAIVVQDAYETLKKITYDFEIIVVDDASRDESVKILKRIKGNIPELKLVLHKSNRGYGGALKSGFKNATKQLIFYTDGDGQYNVREIKMLIGKMTESVDVVQGFKIMRQDPYYRLLIGNLYHYFSKILFGLKIRDVDCDFRLIRKRALDSISLKYDSGVICVELVKKLQDKGFKFAEVGVHHYPRAYGHSQFFNYKRIFKTLIELLQLWINLILLRTG